MVQLRPRLAYSVAAAEADAQRIIDAYRAAGRYAAEVNPVIIRQPDNRVDLVFEITEGRRTSVQRVNFVGNQVFSDRRLRRVIQTNQANWLSFIFGNVTYDADRLELDRELLRQFYLERGYIDIQVLSATAELARERTGFFLSFTVSEGQRYNFGQVSVSSVDPGARTPPTSSRCWRRWRRGASTTCSWSTGSSSAWPSRPARPGYAFVEIRPQVDEERGRRAPSTSTSSWSRASGSSSSASTSPATTRTLDRVIRRQFRIVEGDAFNSREIRDAEDRIRGLGYFEAATVERARGHRAGPGAGRRRRSRSSRPAASASAAPSPPARASARRSA